MAEAKPAADEIISLDGTDYLDDDDSAFVLEQSITKSSSKKSINDVPTTMLSEESTSKEKKRAILAQSVSSSLSSELSELSSIQKPTLPSHLNASVYNSIPTTPHTPITPLGNATQFFFDEQLNDNILPVTCRNKSGQLYKDKLGSGNRGRCILHDNEWYSPTEFETLGGRANSKDWKRSLRYKGRPLHDLIALNLLSPHAPSCQCKNCNEDASSSSNSVKYYAPYKRRPKSESGSSLATNKRQKIHKDEDHAHEDSTSSHNGVTTVHHSDMEYSLASLTNCVAELEKVGTNLHAATETLRTISEQLRQHKVVLEQQMRTEIETIDDGNQIARTLSMISSSLSSQKGIALVQADQPRVSKLLYTPSQDPSAHLEVLDAEHASQCSNCGRETRSVCNNCEKTFYCSEFCQGRDWNNHIVSCEGLSQSSSRSKAVLPSGTQVLVATTPQSRETSHPVQLMLTADQSVGSQPMIIQLPVSAAGVTTASYILPSQLVASQLHPTHSTQAQTLSITSPSSKYTVPSSH
uniref:Deaf1 n=1 Tax=Hofstenia miamia TaxID=442651 RepID=A0A8K1R5S5_HOFMI|nr:deaf1 [Hofstenia miamia]